MPLWNQIGRVFAPDVKEKMAVKELGFVFAQMLRFHSQFFDEAVKSSEEAVPFARGVQPFRSPMTLFAGLVKNLSSSFNNVNFIADFFPVSRICLPARTLRLLFLNLPR